MRPTRTRRLTAAALAALLLAPLTVLSGSAGPALAQSTVPASQAEPTGYVMAGADGTVRAFGDAPFFGTGAGDRFAAPVVDLHVTPDQAGYWRAASDGGVFASGTAPFVGSAGALPLNQPVVGMAATPTGQGYWLVAADGGIFAFGDARFLGSTGALRLNQPVVGMAATPTGQGYWLVAADGGIFAFGDARFAGSTGALRLNQPVVGMDASPDGAGYWLVAADGGIFAFGDARYLGSTGAVPLQQPVVDMAAEPSGRGYTLAAADGGTFAFGEARFFGSLGGRPPTAPIVTIDLATRLPAEFALTVLHNNDGESKVLQGDDDFGGAALFAGLVRELRAAALAPQPGGLVPGAVTISSGDNFLAGPELNASLELAEDRRFYDAVLLDLLDYDAVTIGNHEFDFGPEVLARFVRDTGDDTTFLSANATFTGEPSLQALVAAGRIAPSTVVVQAGRSIGIVGAITPGLPLISSPGNVVVSDEVARIVQDEIDDLLAAGVTRIVLSSHLQGIDEEIELVSQLHGVDVVIAGGGDELLADDDTLLVGDPDDRPTPFAGYPFVGTDASGGAVPIVTTPGDYNYVGRLQVAFDAAGNLLDVLDGGLRRVSAVAPDAATPAQDVQQQVVDPVIASIESLAANVVATSEVALDGRNPDPIRLQESNLGDLVADSMLFAGQGRAAAAGLDVPRVSLQNGGGIRNNSVIPAGDITELDTFSILPFSNIVTIVEDLSPAELKELLEHSVSALPTANGLFGQWGGITFEYDVDGVAQVVDEDTNEVVTAGTRVRNAWLLEPDGSRGAALVTDGVASGGPSVALATADFTGRGGDNYPFADKGVVNNLGVSYQQALLEYLTSDAPAAPGGTLDGLAGVITATDYPPIADVGAALRIRAI